MPVGADVRERLRAAQRAESVAIAAVQKAQVAEADARARLDAIVLKHQDELSQAARSVQAAQAGVVLTSGLERATALLGVSQKVLKSAVKETAADTSVQTKKAQATSVQAISVQDTSDKTPAATTAPTIAPTDT
jgi:hypothetical protein